jgi:hypothetical protein
MSGLDFRILFDVLDWHIHSVFLSEYQDLVGELATRRLAAFETAHGADLIEHCSRLHKCEALRWPNDFPLGSQTLNGVPLTLDAVREVKRLWRGILTGSIHEARSLLGHSDVDAKATQERILFDRVAKAFSESHRVLSRAKPLWLSPQHFDLWFPDDNLGVEFQGVQHFMPVDYFGGAARFVERRQRDLRKQRLCKENGCRLLIVDEDYDPVELLKNLNALLADDSREGMPPITMLLGRQSNSMLTAHEALRSGAALEFDYLARDGSVSHRLVRPIAFELVRRPCLRAHCALRGSERLFAFEAMSNVLLVPGHPGF